MAPHARWLAAGLLGLGGGCYRAPDTLGLPCERDDQCFDSQTCVEQVCAEGDGGSTDATTATATATGSSGPGTGATSDSSASGSGSGAGSTGGSSAATTGPDTGPQPTDGMYAPCEDDPTSCMVPADKCIQIGTGDGMTSCDPQVETCGGGKGCFGNPPTCGDVMDAFCTNTVCTDPAMDCDPPPGGTAEPICVPTGSETHCMLDCSGGKLCPAGMNCYDLGSVEICG